MGSILSVVFFIAAAFYFGVSQAQKNVVNRKLADRNLTSNILLGVFSETTENQKIIDQNIRYQSQFFGGTCWQIDDENCPNVRPDTTNRNRNHVAANSVREAYRMRACTLLTTKDENIHYAILPA